MTKNMGSPDRIIRLVLAAIIFALYLTNVLSGTVAILLIALPVIFILTSFVGTCPLYLAFGLSTIRKKPKT